MKSLKYESVVGRNRYLETCCILSTHCDQYYVLYVSSSYLVLFFVGRNTSIGVRIMLEEYSRRK